MARKILLADDSVTAQNMGRRILTDAGYEVITVNNGSAALKKIAEQLPELIVLDVYMPGYSGLEVCQRLKETRETAKIPILLTVGKLEPFKPEDARRARADAFIVKPFEASELLTALTRLEDKIVPQPAQKAGQFAKVWAALETAAEPGKTEKFGDSDTGWKNRLTIPPPAPKSVEAEPDAEAPKAAKAKGGDGKNKSKSVEAVSVTGLPEVPADITPEEVAAIAAAAAAFEDKSQAQPEEFAVNGSALPEPSSEEAVPTPGSETNVEEPVTAALPEKAALAESTPEATHPATPVSETSASVAEPAVELGAVSGTEKEVCSADVSPASANGNGAATVVASVPPPSPQLAKWIAEVVPLAEGEAQLNLQDEMNKTHAVLQAATAEPDFGAVASAPSFANLAEPVPDALSSIPIGPETESGPYAPPEAAPAMDDQEGSAFAAVASAGPAESVAPSTGSPAPQAEAAPGQRQNESELAAAWAQWKQIRESVVGPQLATQLADVAASQIKEVAQKTEMSVESQSAPEPSSMGPPSNPTAIANIVDSVLAELKPKLVEEIARKLGKEKQD